MTAEKTMVAGIRYKPTTLANIVKYLHSQNYRTKTIGESLRLSVELFERIVIRNPNFKEVIDVREAVTYLQSEGIFSLEDLADRNLERLSSALSLEDLEREREFDKQREEALRALQDSRECQSIEDIKEGLKLVPMGIIEEEE